MKVACCSLRPFSAYRDIIFWPWQLFCAFCKILNITLFYSVVQQPENSRLFTHIPSSCVLPTAWFLLVTDTHTLKWTNCFGEAWLFLFNIGSVRKSELKCSSSLGYWAAYRLVVFYITAHGKRKACLLMYKRITENIYISLKG